jgi:hypothetical protein
MRMNRSSRQKGASKLVIVLLVLFGLFVLAGVAVVGVGWFAYNKVQQAVSESGWDENPALAAARMALSLNPEVEVLEANENEFRLLNKKTGEEIKLSVDDITAGNIEWKTSGGETGSASLASGSITGTTGDGSGASVVMGENAEGLPAGVPGCDCDFRPVMSSTQGGKRQGVLSFTSSKTPAELTEDYKQRLEAGGFADISTMNMGSAHVVTGKLGETTVGFTATTASNGGSSGTLTYNVE